MPIPVTCQCGQAFRANDALAGQSAKCPKCGQPLTIPLPSASEGAPGQLSMEDLMRLDAAAGAMPPQDMPPAEGAAQPSPQAQLPLVGGGFQTPAPQFGQPAAHAGSSGSNRGFFIAIYALGGLGFLAVVGIVLMFVLRGGDGPPNTTATDSAPTASAPAAPQAQPISLAALGDVTLEPGGKATLQLQVQRNGNAGPIQVQLANLPEGVTATGAAIPADQSAGQIELSAADTLGAEELKASLNVTVKVGQVEAAQPLALTVSKLNLPTFQPVGGVIVQPGTTTAVSLTMQRNGYTGPIELRVEGLPANTTGKVASLTAEQNETKLQITAAGNAAEGTGRAVASATVLGRTIQVEIPLQIDKRPFHFSSLQVVTLKPGEEKRVEFPVTRRSHKGTIRLEVTNLPAGVTVPPVELAANEAKAALVLTAAKDAKERVRSSGVIGTAGSLAYADWIVVRVSRGEEGSGGLIPKEITEDPELARLLRRGGFGGRLTTKSKNILRDFYGGTTKSEDAVLRGLAWLAKHQQSDGSWPLKAYNEGIEGCDCCTEYEKGVEDIMTAGTAFGVLPFLGAGVAPNRAPDYPPELAAYQKNVDKAIDYLLKNQVISRDAKSGKLGDGRMYSHALGTMALCEAYGLSGDEKLKVPAQLAIKYLVSSQHKAGGWRYSPGQAGDLSATGWVFLAIRNGQLAGLAIRSTSLDRAQRFVNSCAAGPEDARRSQYAYVPGTDRDPAKPKLTMTAAGLLSQQYLGWKRERPDLITGAEHLMKHPPPKAAPALGDIYYQYYATQVLHHMGGENFDLWNHVMREHLIRTQQRGGHKDGSWNPRGATYGNRGGRIYSTSLALMTLQVYYRHLPLYGPVIRRQVSSGSSGSQ